MEIPCINKVNLSYLMSASDIIHVFAMGWSRKNPPHPDGWDSGNSQKGSKTLEIQTGGGLN